MPARAIIPIGMKKKRVVKVNLSRDLAPFFTGQEPRFERCVSLIIEVRDML